MRELLAAVAIGAVIAALLRRPSQPRLVPFDDEPTDYTTDIYVIGLAMDGEFVELESPFPFIGTTWRSDTEDD